MAAPGGSDPEVAFSQLSDWEPEANYKFIRIFLSSLNLPYIKTAMTRQMFVANMLQVET